MFPRPIFRGATYMVTRRCTQRQFLLTPSGEVSRAFRYCLGYAAAHTGVLIHAVVVMGNHYHLIVTDPLGVLPVFVECLNKLVAKCLNAYRGRWENFWASEQASYVRLLDTQAVIDKMAYVLCNPVAAGLVKRGHEWPGVRIGTPGLRRERRPNFFFREDGGMPKSVVLDITTPILDGMTARESQARISEAVAAQEAKDRSRVIGEGRTFVGARAVMRQNPFSSPTTREPRRQLSPRIASRNKWLRIEALARCAEFVRVYREALTAWCREQRDVCFPCGTYLMRTKFRVRCAEA